MRPEHLEYFGQFLMKRVRDMSIQHWERIISGRLKSAEAQAMHQKIASGGAEVALIEEIVSKAVDTTLHNFLCALEEDDDVAVIVDRNGCKENVRILSDGLAGELYTEDGWIARFSGKSK